MGNNLKTKKKDLASHKAAYQSSHPQFEADNGKTASTTASTTLHKKLRTLSSIYKTQSQNTLKKNNAIISGKKLLDIFINSQLINKLEKEEINLSIHVSNIIQEGKGMLSDKYQIVTKLAHGATGSVFIAKNIISNQTVAVKLTEKANRYIIDNLQFKNEIILLKNLNHPNIVRLLEFYESPTAFYMISELCKYGELYDRIKRGFTERELSVILYQLFSALDYCHENNIIHRDLKLENILVNDIEKVKDELNDNKEIECFWIKLIDFGTAKLFMRNRNERTIVGTSYYIAPEVLKKNYNEKCDTWSVGVVLYILLTGKAPFDGKNDQEVLHKVRNGLMDDKNPKLLQSSPECQDLIKRLLEVKIEKRLSAKDALDHPWFTQNRTRDLLKNISQEKVQPYVNNLFDFSIKSKLHQIIIAYLSHNLLMTNELNDILKILRMFDLSNEARLSYADLYNGLCKFKPLEEVSVNIDQIFITLDSNNDGYIEYEELLRGMIPKDGIMTDEMLKLAFKFFDKNNSNSINLNSIKKTLENSKLVVSDRLCKKFFDEMNVNGNEKDIYFSDFKQYMLS